MLCRTKSCNDFICIGAGFSVDSAVDASRISITGALIINSAMHSIFIFFMIVLQCQLNSIARCLLCCAPALNYPAPVVLLEKPLCWLRIVASILVHHGGVS